MPRRRFPVPVALLAAALLTLSGCLTVHGEEVKRPAVTDKRADRVLAEFAKLNNRANEDFDLDVNARIEAGGLGAIDQAGLKVRKAEHPEGNPGYEPLAFSDTRYLIPEQTGWPRWFVADTETNRGSEYRWLLVFTKPSAQARWKATHLSLLTEDDLRTIGDFATDADGNVRPVPPGKSSKLSVPPGRLSAAYAEYLQGGESGGDGAVFAPGEHTSERRESRKQYLRTPDYVTQYVDKATPEYPPVAIRLKDGGALVLFSSRHFIKQTMAEGRTVSVGDEAEVLLEGTAKKSLTLERVSQQMAVVPPRGGGGDAASGDGIVFYNRLEGLVGAKGS